MDSEQQAPAMKKKKPVLVLDLDHTLLHSTALSDMPPQDAARLQLVLSRTSPRLPPGLHLHPHLLPPRLTKFRPFVHRFLRAASSMFELYVYTMATPPYAAAMAQVLDPSGRLFHGRIISRPAAPSPRVKTLANIPHPESAVLIIDDTPRIWQPDHQANVIAIDRYCFFSSCCAKPAPPSLLPALQDESESDGALARTLGLLCLLHNAWQRGPKEDMRDILRRLRARTLAGCRLAFPIPATAPDSFWHLAQSMGATCSRTLDDSVTHVVAAAAGTPPSLPHRNDVHVVHPAWILAAFFTWMRPAEILHGADAAPTLSFSEVIDYMHAHDDHRDVHESAAHLIDMLAAALGPPSASTTTSCSHHDVRRTVPGAPSATPP